MTPLTSIDELIPFTTSLLTVIGWVAFTVIRNPSVNSTSWIPDPVMLMDCCWSCPKGLNTLLVSIVFLPIAMYSPSMAFSLIIRTVESVLYYLSEFKETGAENSSFSGISRNIFYNLRVDTFDPLHNYPCLPV